MTTYEIAIDPDPAFGNPSVPAVAGTSVASGPLSVSTTPPVGTRYWWMVRACNGAPCSAWSTARFVDVGRVLGDFDGDGYGDALVGMNLASPFTSFSGAVFVYAGGPGGLGPSPDATLHPYDEIWGGGFGLHVAYAGDFDGDGYQDALISASVDTLGHPGVYVYFGGPSGLSTFAEFQDFGSDFGASIASAGDQNFDGYDEFLIGRPSANLVWVCPGNPSRTLDINTCFGKISPNAVSGGNFGASVAGRGDYDGDGRPDIVIGAPGEGNAYLYDSFGAQQFFGPAGSSYGAGVALVDVDDDRLADVMIGAPDALTGSGELFFMRSSTGGGGPIIGLPQTGQRLGADLANSFDADGDGHGDLIAGAPLLDDPGTDNGGGYVVNPIYGAETLSGSANDGAHGGTTVGGTDFDGDGLGDVLLAAPDDDDGGTALGTVAVYAGAPGGPVPAPTPVLHAPTTLGTPSHFGNSVSR
jgi:hypothetical protein